MLMVAACSRLRRDRIEALRHQTVNQSRDCDPQTVRIVIEAGRSTSSFVTMRPDPGGHGSSTLVGCAPDRPTTAGLTIGAESRRRSTFSATFSATPARVGPVGIPRARGSHAARERIRRIRERVDRPRWGGPDRWSVSTTYKCSLVLTENTYRLAA